MPFMSVSGSDFMEMFVGVGRQPGPRPVPDGPQAGPGHRLHRRDRLHRPQAGRRPRRRPRRAGADPQPDALRDGRLRHHRGRRDDGRHQPARHPRPRPAAARAASTARSWCPCPTSTSACPSCRSTARTSGWHPTSTSGRVARGTPGHERRRPGQPGQRGGPPRRAPGRPSVIQHVDFEAARDRVLHGPAAREPGAVRRRRRSAIAYHEGGHAVLAYVLARRRPGAQGDHPARRAWRSASPSSSRWRSATSTPASTSRTPSASGWAAGSPSCWSTATCRPAPPTTWSATPSWPARWSASGA